MKSPNPISIAELRRRTARVRRIARSLGFVGIVEYRHISTTSGGAQFGKGASIKDDVLTVFAEAFERDADPEDFCLEALVAHERGHQVFARHPMFETFAAFAATVSEEVVASMIGATIVDHEIAHRQLTSKAAYDLLAAGIERRAVEKTIAGLSNLLEGIL